MRKPAIIAALVVLAGALPVVLSSCNRTETALTSLICFREFDRWREVVALADGTLITVNHRHSNDPCISFGLFGGIGSGDDHFSVAEFAVPPGKFRWAVARDERPIVLRLDQDRPWLATFDRTDMRNIGFRFYTFAENGRAREIPAADFPKRLAIQNLWLSKANGTRDGRPVNEYEIAAALDPGSIDFPRSLTAKLWLCLDQGLPYGGDEVDPVFLGEYKKKYLGPTPDSPGAPADADKPGR
jgi:hypothetical protein